MATWNEVLELANWDGEFDPSQKCGLLAGKNWDILSEEEANACFEKRAPRTRLELGEVEGGEDFSSEPIWYCAVTILELSAERVLARIECTMEEPVYALGVAA